MKILVLSQSSSFDGHLRKVLSSGNRILFYAEPEEVGEAQLEEVSAALIHAPSFVNEIETVISQLGGSPLSLGVATDNPSLDEMLMLSGLGGKAYFNSYMAEIHYRQMASFITTGQHWYLPELLSLALRIAKNSVNGSSSDEWNRLTPREKEIAQAVSSGLNNKEIARMCDITERTVKAHLSHVFEKMGVKDRVSLVIRITSKNPFTHSA